MTGNSTSGLLGQASLTQLEAVERFVFADKFKLGAVVDGRTIVWLGAKFVLHFKDVVEENVPAREMKASSLLKVTDDPEVIAALGEHAEVHLAHLYRIIELGEKGPGLFNGWGNIGYRRSPIDNQLWAVRWHVLDGGIYIGSRPGTVPGEWGSGPMVHGG
jgi:hypothetical protein